MASRVRVLSAFKEIHRTCQTVYAGNRQALKASRWKINTEFKRFKDEASPKKIEEHIQFARDASRLVRLTAVQGAASNRFSDERVQSSHRDTGKGRSASNYQQPRRRRDRSLEDSDKWDGNVDADCWDTLPSGSSSRSLHLDDHTQSKDYPYPDYGFRPQYKKKSRHINSTCSDDYPYTDYGVKPQYKKKSRHIDFSNMDLSEMTGKR